MPLSGHHKPPRARPRAWPRRLFTGACHTPSTFSASKHSSMLTFDGLTISVATSVSARCDAALPLPHEGRAHATHHHPRRRLISMVRKQKTHASSGYALAPRVRHPIAIRGAQHDETSHSVSGSSDYGSIGHRRPPTAVHAQREKTPHRTQARPEPGLFRLNI